MHSLQTIKRVNSQKVWKVIKEHGYFYAKHAFLNKTSDRFDTESAAMDWVKQQ